MNRIACIYFEGNDSKVALFSKEKDKLFLLKAESLDTSLTFSDNLSQKVSKSNGNGNGKQKEVLNYDFVSGDTSDFNGNYLQKLNGLFSSEVIQKINFIPVIGEPAIYFQKLNDEKEILNFNNNGKGNGVATIGYVELFDGSTLAVYPSGKSNYLQVLDSLAKINEKKYLKIPSVKSAEISLASYIARKNKFKESENSLILYVGKEYSKLIFLSGKKLHQISPALSVGKNSFNAHNVIISKILLEMEHAGFSKLDKIVVCGEDESKDFISIIKESYPQAKVGTLTFDEVEIIGMDSFSNVSSFTIPIAVADEYYNELNKSTAGINLLPKYIKEEQKPFKLGWQSYLMILLIFVTAVFLSFKIVENKTEIKNMRNEIRMLRKTVDKNREMVNKIRSYKNKIKNVDQTKITLGRLSNGTGIFSSDIKKLADFTGSKKNLWISNFRLDQDKHVQINGYTLSRQPVRELSDSYRQSLLQNIIFEPLRDYRAFKFLIVADGENNITEGKAKR